ncbi:M28 family peptidase [Aureivirga marina]|uniref:M28 family peptidase n=1 Tax=Aureivirga marina TaxID=1182451 RepID=UPI0018C8FD2A|nr:M28 family peptidase [Aureivirga marina]
MKKITLLITLISSFIQAQTTIESLINQTSLDNMTTYVRELSGEDPTVVNNENVTITHRVSYAGSGNNLAADYIVEKLNETGLTVTVQNYSSTGRNIYATQLGTVNPNDIYIVCAHYDAVSYFCADDNASGVAGVLETARILSEQCFENTIIYALWDEEENGLKGSNYFSDYFFSQNKNIVGVVNIDMMGYDGDNDKVFDIDINNNTTSTQIKDDLISIVDDYDLDIIPLVVNPGTYASDHASFWSNSYGAVLLGESWENDDITPGYHSSSDRISLFNMPYFHEMGKLITGYITTKGVLCAPNDNSNEEEEQEEENLNTNDIKDIKTIFYPNPTRDIFEMDFSTEKEREISVFSLLGKKVLTLTTNNKHVTINLKNLEAGTYIVEIKTKNGEKFNLYNIIKE